MNRPGKCTIIRLTAIVALAITVSLLSSLEAQERYHAGGAVTQRTMAAVSSGLQFLKSPQQNQDGSYGTNYQLANSALAGLALLGNGNTYNRGPYGEQLAKVLHYILKCQDRWTGYIDDNQSRMHGHGYATLFLAEVYGMLPPTYQERVYKALKMACKVIMESQTGEGGWGYQPVGYAHSYSDEGSITITQVQALRAARNAGINVPKTVIEKGIKYIERCMTPEGCRYTLRSGRKTYTLTAAAVSVLNAAGVYHSKALDMGLNVMRKRIAAEDIPMRASEWPWYGNLYAAQAMWQAGGDDWNKWYEKSYKWLLDTQRPNGSWSGARGGWGSGYGDVFATSIACLILEIPVGYLPIFER